MAERQKKMSQPAVKGQVLSPRSKLSPPSRSPSNIPLKSSIKKPPKTPLKELDQSEDEISSTDKEDFLVFTVFFRRRKQDATSRKKKTKKTTAIFIRVKLGMFKTGVAGRSVFFWVS